MKIKTFGLIVVCWLSILVPLGAQTAEQLATYTGRTLPTPETIPDIVILKTRPNQGFNIQSGDAISAMAKQLGAKTIRKMAPDKGVKVPFGGGATTYILEFPSSTNVQNVIKSLKGKSSVDYVEPAYVVKLFGDPNDTEFPQQTYLNTSKLGKLLALPANHEVTIAVIDTGIDETHPDLAGHLISGYNFISTPNLPTDDSGHGTHLSGIIGARINNKMGAAGLNPKSKIMSLKIANSNGIGSQVAAADAIRYAVDNGAKVINCSWGYFMYNQILKEAIEYAVAREVVVVAAMGNQGSPLTQFPAGFPGVISVGAMDSSLKRASFSNIGDHLGFMAEGVNILSLAPNGKTAVLNGTSQSAAIVTGIISRILSYNPKFTAQEIGTILMLSSEPMGDGQRTPETGHGYIDVEKLFVALNAPSTNGFVSEDGVLNQEYNPKQSKEPAASEPLWLTILLIPYRIVEFLFTSLF